jgi:hypothetical protein
VGVEDADKSPASVGGNDPGDGVYPADTIVVILENGLQLRSGSSLRRVSADISGDILPLDKRCLLP